jgi:hypothetical protein
MQEATIKHGQSIDCWKSQPAMSCKGASQFLIGYQGGSTHKHLPAVAAAAAVCLMWDIGTLQLLTTPIFPTSAAGHRQIQHSADDGVSHTTLSLIIGIKMQLVA